MSSCAQSLGAIRHVALDMDGTIYLGDQMFQSTPGFLSTLAQLEIGYSFLTNNSSHHSEQYVTRLRDLGLSVKPDQVYTSAQATAEYLHEHFPGQRRLLILGTPGMQREFCERGFESCPIHDPSPDLEVVGFDRTLQYEGLCRAAWWIAQGKPFIATHPDRLCPTNQPTLLVDCGAICAALAEATGRSPTIIGKPNPRMLQGLRTRYGLRPEEVAVVGDRLTTDIALARQSGALGVLVLTGEAKRHDAERSSWRPDLIVEDLGELGELFQQAASLRGTMS